jgi:hypothetical protein
MGTDNDAVPDMREFYGRLVRECWIARARQHPNPKPSWLVPWEELDEWDRETDRCIGEAVAACATAAVIKITEAGEPERDDAYYDELRRAVSKGTPTALLGTPTKFLEQYLVGLKVERRLLKLIANPSMNRRDVAVTYRLAMRDAQDCVNWTEVNKAIIVRWSVSGLKWIKEFAWSRQ